jgi:hypothetical protein
MNGFEIVTVIERPVERVFAVVPDVTKTPLWEPGLLELAEPLVVGLAKRQARTAAGSVNALLEQNAP